MCTFLGVIRCDFKDKETGEAIQGWHLWLGEPADAPSSGLRPVKKWLTDIRAESIFGPVGGILAAGKYAGASVDVELGLRGQIMNLRFPQQK